MPDNREHPIDKSDKASKGLDGVYYVKDPHGEHGAPITRRRLFEEIHEKFGVPIPPEKPSGVELTPEDKAMIEEAKPGYAAFVEGILTESVSLQAMENFQAGQSPVEALKNALKKALATLEEVVESD